MDYKYSEKELDMFKQLGFDLTSNDVLLRTLPPFMLYNMAAKHCFLHKIIENEVTESLRNCLIAMEEFADSPNKIFRDTPEFDNLIKL